MTSRLSVTALRLVVLVGIWLLGTSTLSLAQEDPAESSQTAPVAQADATAAQAPLVVPDVIGLPYVFAKGELEDAGFAWKVSGKVEGFAVNLVAEQNVKPGTEVVDTGAPTVVLRLESNPAYEELGLPEQESPYRGTKLVPLGELAAESATESASPEGGDQAASDEAAAPSPSESATPAGEPPTEAETIEPEPAAVTTETGSGADADSGEVERETRPPAFEVPGAPNEPLDETPLPQRAAELGAWVEELKELTPAALDHFAYQHAWIVTGASFGWWRGEEALRKLVEVDRRLAERFDAGADYETEARKALEAVVRHSS